MDQADIRKERLDALLAIVESFRANACLKLVQRGEHTLADKVVAHCEAALQLLAGEEHLSDRRSLYQVAGESLLAAGRYEAAVDFFRLALDTAEETLVQAESIAGRMERIWQFRDSSALLSWCLLRLGQTAESLRELGGWLRAYNLRNSQHREWRDTIDIAR